MSTLDDLTAIAGILDKYGAGGDLRPMMRRLATNSGFNDCPLTFDVRTAIEARRRYQDIGQVTLLNVVLRDLQFSRRAGLSKELRVRIEIFLELLRKWECRWRHVVKANAPTANQHAKELTKQRPAGYPEWQPEVGWYFQEIDGKTHDDALTQLAELSDYAEDTVSWIRQMVIALRQRSQRTKSAHAPTPDSSSQNVSAVKSAKLATADDWIHDRGEVPPKEYWAKDPDRLIGPVVGTQAELGSGYYYDKFVVDPQLRDTLKDLATQDKPLLWIRKSTGRNLEAFFRDFPTRDQFAEAVKTYPARKLAKAKESARKSTKPKRPKKT